MSIWSLGTWTMWERSTYITVQCGALHTYCATAVWGDEVTKTFLCHWFCLACCSCSPGSSSQKKIPTTACPSHCLAPPPSWPHSPHPHLSPRSFLKTWIWGCRSPPTPMVKCRGRALLWWDLDTVIECVCNRLAVFAIMFIYLFIYFFEQTQLSNRLRSSSMTDGVSDQAQAPPLTVHISELPHVPPSFLLLCPPLLPVALPLL